MVDFSEARRANLNAYCVRKGWVSQKNPSQGSPSKLVEVLGRSSSFWSDRLSGTREIGEDVARDIEEKLLLAKYALDGGEADPAAWPLSDDLLRKLRQLSVEDLWHAENSLRAHLKLDPLPRSSGGDGQPLPNGTTG